MQWYLFEKVTKGAEVAPAPLWLWDLIYERRLYLCGHGDRESTHLSVWKYENRFLWYDRW